MKLRAWKMWWSDKILTKYLQITHAENENDQRQRALYKCAHWIAGKWRARKCSKRRYGWPCLCKNLMNDAQLERYLFESCRFLKHFVARTKSLVIFNASVHAIKHNKKARGKKREKQTKDKWKDWPYIDFYLFAAQLVITVFVDLFENICGWLWITNVQQFHFKD